MGSRIEARRPPCPGIGTSAAQIGFIEIRGGEVGVIKAGATKAGPAKVRVAQIRSRKVRILE